MIVDFKKQLSYELGVYFDILKKRTFKYICIITFDSLRKIRQNKC